MLSIRRWLSSPVVNRSGVRTIVSNNRVEPDRGVREREERKRQRQEALPARLALDTTLTVGRGEVVLVTYDRGVRRLVVVDGSRQ